VIAIATPMFAAFSAPLQSHLGARVELLANKSADAYYESLDPIRKAGLLNLSTKATFTRQANGSPVFPPPRSSSSPYSRRSALRHREREPV
jgi:hypothetical protein